MDYSKSNCKLFQKKVPDWQEAYIGSTYRNDQKIDVVQYC